MSYKCNTGFKSINGTTYNKGTVINFDEYYRLAEIERKYFTFCQAFVSYKEKKEDRIR